MIRKMMLFLLLLAMIFASTACSSDSESKSKRRTNSSRSDSKNDPFSFMDTDLFDTTPHVPEEMYISQVQEAITGYCEDSPVEIDAEFEVQHIPNESMHQETVQVEYRFRSDCGYYKAIRGGIYQYYSSDDLWENKDWISGESTFVLYPNTFPGHWEGSTIYYNYIFDILEIDTKAQTITISYSLDSRSYKNNHITGTQTITYSLTGSRCRAELTDTYHCTIYLSVKGLECYS